MRKTMKTLTVLIMMISVLTITGCSGREAQELPPVADKIADVTKTPVPEAPAQETQPVPEEDPAEDDTTEIKIVRDDRSIDPKKEFGYDGYVLKSYYETALLPETVKNHEKINAAIEAKKEEFFSKDGYRKEVGLDELYGEIGTFGSPDDWHCFAAVNSIYLDEKYYSVNVEYYSCFGGTDISEFRGYTFDLDTGEEVTLNDVLGMDDSELSALLHDKVREYFTEEVGMNEYPAAESFLEDEAYGSFHYCIVGDGRVYVLYDKYRIATGNMGSFAYYLCKYSDDTTAVRYSEISDLDGGGWHSLTGSQLDELYKARKLTEEDKNRIMIYEQAPYCKDGRFYDPVAYYNNTLPCVFDEIIYWDVVDIDDPTKVSQQDDLADDVLSGTYYSTETVTDELTQEDVPANCGFIDRYEIRFYEYDPYEHCYKESVTRSIDRVRRTLGGYIFEFYDEEDPGKVWTAATHYNDPYWFDVYYSSVTDYDKADFFADSRKTGGLISTRSRDFEWVFKTDRDYLFYPTKDCVSASLAAPRVNDGINYLVPDAVSIRFNWDAVDGAEGYEVWEEESGERDPDYRIVRFSEVTDHWYETGGQDTFIHTIKVRAFKTEDGRRVYSEWSPVATGKESNPFAGASSVTGDGSDKNVYKPVLDEYAKVFKGDETVYGMRAPQELYYEVKSFDGFDINDFYYAFRDLDPDFNENVELLILKEKDGKNCLYSIYRGDSYPLELDLDYVLNKEDYSSTDIPKAKEGEDIFLYEDGIIARSKDEDGYSVRNYIRLVSEPDMVPFYWEMVETIVRVTDGSGNSKYYKSEDMHSLEYYPTEKKDLYKEITEKEYNDIQTEYEVPADLVRNRFADYNGTP